MRSSRGIFACDYLVTLFTLSASRPGGEIAFLVRLTCCTFHQYPGRNRAGTFPLLFFHLLITSLRLSLFMQSPVKIAISHKDPGACVYGTHTAQSA